MEFSKSIMVLNSSQTANFKKINKYLILISIIRLLWSQCLSKIVFFTLKNLHNLNEYGAGIMVLTCIDKCWQHWTTRLYIVFGSIIVLLCRVSIRNCLCLSKQIIWIILSYSLYYIDSACCRKRFFMHFFTLHLQSTSEFSNPEGTGKIGLDKTKFVTTEVSGYPNFIEF